MTHDLFKTTYNSPLGTIWIESDGFYLTGLYFEDQRFFEVPEDPVNYSVTSVPIDTGTFSMNEESVSKVSEREAFAVQETPMESGESFYASEGNPAMLVPVIQETIKWLDIYFDGRDPGPIPQVKLKGTPFQQMVWEILQRIPYGKTVSYKDIANVITLEHGGKMSAQAVGQAVGRNPVSIIVPCHRVLGADGSMTGYGGGLDRKISLLIIEDVLSL